MSVPGALGLQRYIMLNLKVYSIACVLDCDFMFGLEHYIIVIEIKSSFESCAVCVGPRRSVSGPGLCVGPGRSRAPAPPHAQCKTVHSNAGMLDSDFIFRFKRYI